MFANILYRFSALSQCTLRTLRTLRWFKHVLAGFRPKGIVKSVAKVSTLSQCRFKFS